MEKRLTREFFIVNSYELAKKLLGKVICINKDDSIKRYRIVEVEAYGGAVDKASHAYGNLKTARTSTLYLIGGHIYIYLIYGMYHMMNFIANHEGIPEGVLIRAVEPINYNAGLVTNGPGKLCSHLGINRSYNGLDLCESDLIYLVDDGYTDFEVVSAKRIGIDYAEEDKDLLYRFYISGNIYVSKK
jgi:DNA-3-methyladenine glycosylase